MKPDHSRISLELRYSAESEIEKPSEPREACAGTATRTTPHTADSQKPRMGAVRAQGAAGCELNARTRAPLGGCHSEGALATQHRSSLSERCRPLTPKAWTAQA